MKTNALTTTKRDDALAILADVGERANEAAAGSAFADYRARKAPSTLRRQDAGLALFSDYLVQAAGSAPTGAALASIGEAWRGVTWGLVDGFVKFALLKGYAVSTVNVRLSTVKTYAKLAAKAGGITPQTLAMIRMVQGYSHKESRHVDDRRAEADIPTRRSAQKTAPVVLSAAQVEVLKDQPDTPQGRRDRVLLGLMLDLGLRCGEVGGLTVDCVNLKRGELTFYREKVDKTQTHRLVNGLQAAISDYLTQDAPPIGALLRASRRGSGGLTHAGMSKRAVTARVRALGRRAGIEGLSAHDLRHTWATLAARNGTPLERLRDAGGWASLAMPARYVAAAEISNEGIVLG